MALQISVWAALWFLPFVLPVCLYVSWSDMRAMRIPNQAVLVLAVIFLFIGLIAVPLADYPWRLLQLVIILVIGFVMNATGLIGAGDAKFAAAAAPFIHPGDTLFLMILFACTLLAAFAAHRLGKYTPLRRAAPEWKSWDTGSDFPMGLALGGTLGLYLMLGAVFGA